MDEDEVIRAEVRRTRRQVKLGPDACCLLCGEKNPDVLRLVNRTLLDEHHVAGVGNLEELKVPVCANCHRKLHGKLSDMGLDFEKPAKRVVLEVLYYLVMGMSVFFAQSAHLLQLLGRALRALIGSLDAHFDGWRELPEAQF
jgi:hypothetical protein